MIYEILSQGRNKMDDFFEFLGFQDAIKQAESNKSISDISNDLIMNSNYRNTTDLNSDLVNIQLQKAK